MGRLTTRSGHLVGVAVALSVVISACGSGSTTETKDAGTVTASGKQAAAQATRTARTELAAAAGYLGVSVARLRAELRGGKSLAEVARKTPGKSEAGLIAAVTRLRTKRASKSVERQVGAQVRTPGLRPVLSLREDAREYLGLSVPQLRARAKGGKSLAQIAREIPGKSEAGMIDAIFGAREHQLEAAVKAGRLRADVEKLTLLHLRERIRTYVRRFKVGQSTQQPAGTPK